MSRASFRVLPAHYPRPPMPNAAPSRYQRKTSRPEAPEERKMRELPASRAVATVPAMATESQDVVTMEKIVALCKRRGFIFQSSEIYGGLASTYDYGHYGVLLKRNVKDEWWRAMIQQREDMVALDAAILMHPRVWEASGPLEGFTDPLVQCLGECKRRWREDHLREAAEAEGRSAEG